MKQKEQKDELGRNLPWILGFSIVLGIACSVSAETTHWLMNIGAGLGMGFLAFFSLSSAFLSK